MSYVEIFQFVDYYEPKAVDAIGAVQGRRIGGVEFELAEGGAKWHAHAQSLPVIWAALYLSLLPGGSSAVRNARFGSSIHAAAAQAPAPLLCQPTRVCSPGCAPAAFLESVTRKGELLREGLRRELAGNPHVKEVRGLGLICGVELDQVRTVGEGEGEGVRRMGS